MLNDLIGGQVKFYFSNAAASIGHVQSGVLKCLAHTGRGRLATLPDVPAVAETLPGFEAYEWNGVFVPAGTAPEIVAKLNAGLNAVLRQPDIGARLAQLNVERARTRRRNSAPSWRPRWTSGAGWCARRTSGWDEAARIDGREPAGCMSAPDCPRSSQDSIMQPDHDDRR